MTPYEMAVRLEELSDTLAQGTVTTRTLDYREVTERDSAGRLLTTITIVIVMHPPDQKG